MKPKKKKFYILDSMKVPVKKAGESAKGVVALAEAIQKELRTEGEVAAEVKLGREALATLQSEHAAKLNVWVRERQVAAVHAWACALGVELRLRAFTSVEAFMAANEPMMTDLVLEFGCRRDFLRFGVIQLTFLLLSHPETGERLE